VLLFSHKHPDAYVLARVEKLEILQFVFQEFPIRGVEKQDPTAYLRFRH
jgi:hypothetical protein